MHGKDLARIREAIDELRLLAKPTRVAIQESLNALAEVQLRNERIRKKAAELMRPTWRRWWRTP